MIAAATLPLLHPAGHALLTMAMALPDTVVTVSAPAQGFAKLVSTVQSIASLIIAFALIAIAIPLIPAAWNSRKMYARINDVIERFRSDIDPIVKHAVSVADNLDYVSTSIRVDVQQLNQTIAATNRRLNHAASLAEQRLNEFNGLLQVVQEEAENLFIGTASAIRGVQVGADTFRAYQTDDDFTDEELEAYAAGDVPDVAPPHTPRPRGA
ncbi:MAG: hypothetical protein JWM27_21 [Gemmatimonadetes bacterium]|nr:hypothetical protein [Gemmatimonadota bacterium]